MFINTNFYFVNRMKAYGGADSDESDTEVAEVDVDKLPPIELGPDDHKLQYTYCLWYHRGSYKIKNPSVCIGCGSWPRFMECQMSILHVRISSFISFHTKEWILT